MAYTACHGQTGISVSGDIPNLAGQKAKYLVSQLKAFKAGTRKNPLMSVMAGQLSEADMANVAAFFSSLSGPAEGAMAMGLEDVNKTRVQFPADYQQSFTHYTTISFPKRKQVREYYANPAAVTGVREGKMLPDGAMFFVEIYKAKLGEDKKPITGADGHFEKGKLAAYTAMQKQPGWGDQFPDMIRNADWNYAVFKADHSLKAGVNQAKCLVCHVPEANNDYVFSLGKLAAKLHK